MVRRRVSAVSNHMARVHPSRRAQERAPQDEVSVSPLGVASPGADHAFLAAEFVTLAGRLVERAGNLWLDRVAVGAAGIGHVDRERGAGAFHRHRGAGALALLDGRGAGLGFTGIIVSLAIGAAFADREYAGRK